MDAWTIRSWVVIFSVSVAITLEPLMVVLVGVDVSVLIAIFEAFRLEAFECVVLVSVEVLEPFISSDTPALNPSVPLLAAAGGESRVLPGMRATRPGCPSP